MNATWTASKDKYGRPVKHLVAPYVPGQGARTLGAVVTLPKGAEVHFGGNRYLANDWTAERTYPVTPETTAKYVTYHPTLNAAKAHLERVAR